MQIEHLSHGTFAIEATDTGYLTISNARQQVLSIRLLSFDRGFEQPFPYDKLKETPLFPACDADHPDSLTAQDVYSLDRQGDVLTVSKSVGSWRLWQDISIEQDACVIRSFIRRPPNCELPGSLNVMTLGTADLPNEASIFLVSEMMGSFRIDHVDSFSDGDLSRMLFAIQLDHAAVLVNSEVGSANTLCMGKSGNSWHGFVSLPKVSDSDILALGSIEIRVGEYAQRMLEEFAARTAPSTLVKSSPICWNSR